MQAVILAAGRSTRTLPLTTTRPKPLIPVWGRPLLERQLDQLQGLVSEVLLVVGYRSDQIRGQFGEGYRDVRIRYVTQEQQRGTADAVLAARPLVQGRSLVLNGDDFYHHDDLERLLRGGRGLLVTRAPDPQNRAVVSLDGDRITNIVEKPSSPPPDALSSVGGYCLEGEDLELLDRLRVSPRGELELPDLVLELVRSRTVHAREIRKFWMPLTYAWDVLGVMHALWEDPQRAAELGLTGTPDGPELPGEGPIFVGEGVRIAEGVRLVGPAALGPGTRVEEGAALERVVTFADVRVGRGAHIADSVLGERVVVGPGCRLESRPGSELLVDVKGKPVVPEIARLGAIVGDGVTLAEGSAPPAGSVLPAVESA